MFVLFYIQLFSYFRRKYVIKIIKRSVIGFDSIPACTIWTDVQTDVALQHKWAR